MKKTGRQSKNIEDLRPTSAWKGEKSDWQVMSDVNKVKVPPIPQRVSDDLERVVMKQRARSKMKSQIGMGM